MKKGREGRKEKRGGEGGRGGKGRRKGREEKEGRQGCPPLSEILNTPLYGVVLPSHQGGFGEGVSKDFKRFFTQHKPQKATESLLIQNRYPVFTFR